MDIRIEDNKKDINPTVGDIVVSRKGNTYIISYEPKSETSAKYIARSLNGLADGANGYFHNVKDLWETLQNIGFTLYSQKEYELVITKKIKYPQ